MDDDSGDEEGNESEEDIWRYTYKLEMDITSNRVLSHDIPDLLSTTCESFSRIS